MDKTVTVAIIEALGNLAWPALAVIILWKVYPTLKDIVASRGFSVKVGEMEVTVQEASDQLRLQLEDLQEKVATLREQIGERSEQNGRKATVSAPLAEQPLKRILWVDDEPSNNAFEIAKLRDDGIDVIQALSTSEAMHAFMKSRQPIDVVISDIGRIEDGEYRSKAGLELIKAARDAGVTSPIFVYTSARYVHQNNKEVLAAGGNGATASPVELFEMIRNRGKVAASYGSGVKTEIGSD